MLQSPSGRGSLFHGSCSVLRRSGGVRQISCGDLTLDLVKGRALEEGTGPVSFHAGMSSPGSYGDKPGADPEPEPPFGGDLGCGREFVNDNTLTVYIKRLREKIEDNPQDPRYIVTVRGAGYRML